MASSSVVLFRGSIAPARAHIGISVALSLTRQQTVRCQHALNQTLLIRRAQVSVATAVDATSRGADRGQSQFVASEPLHPAVAEALVNEANHCLEESRGHWSRSEYAECADKCRRVADEILGPARPDSLREATWQQQASARVNAACALKALHRHEEALSECEQGLKLMERRLPKSRDQVMQILDLLGELYLLCGRLDEADRSVARAIQLKEPFPWRQASMAVSLNLQAQAKAQRGDFTGARTSFRRALAAHVGKLSTNSSIEALPVGAAVVLSNYAGLLREQRETAEAVAVYGKAIEIFETKLGPDNEAVGRTLMELGVTQLSAGLGGSVAAEPLTRALVVLTGALGADHPSVLATIGWLAKCRDEGVQPAEATPMLTKQAGCPMERLLTSSP